MPQIVTAKKLSQIPLAPAPPALTDTLIGVQAETTDYQYTLAQVGGSLSVRTPVPAGSAPYIPGIQYYVAIGGSDSNPGTLAQPWATVSHAEAFISGNLDFQGNLVTVNIGAGTFAGFIALGKVGGGNLQYQGAGPGTTILTPTFELGFPVEVVQVPHEDTTVISVDGVTFQPKGEPAMNCFFGGKCIWGNNLLSQSNNAVDLSLANGCDVLTVSDPGSLIVLNGNVNFPTPTQVSGAPATNPLAAWYNAFANGFIENFENWNFTGSPTIRTGAGFASLEDFGFIAEGNESFTGTVNGARLALTGGSSVSSAFGPNQLGATYYPGTSFGSVDITSIYDGNLIAQSISGAPTTGQLPISGAWGVFDGGVGNRWVAVNSGGTIFKVQLT